MGLFVVVDEGVEFPGAGGSVGFAVRGDMVSGFEISKELCLGLRRSQEFDLGIGVLKSGRVPFLAGRLILLVGLVPFAVELLAGDFVLIEITAAEFIRFAVDNIDS